MLRMEEIADLDGAGACVALGRVRTALVQAEVAELVLAAHWADLHPGEAVEERRRARRRQGGRLVPGSERGRQIAADGTPLVAEFAAMEFGAHLGLGCAAATGYLRDALNLRHRHPVLWARLEQALDPAPADSDAAATAAATDDAEDADGVDVGARAGALPRTWQAREVSRMCAHAGLDRDQARFVDAATTPYLGVLPWGRFKDLVAAKIIEADPAAAEARRQAAEAARFVRTGQSTEHGLKTLIVRANAGDVIFFVAMVDRIAHILRWRGDRSDADVLKSKAVGILAAPALALRMLEEHAALFGNDTTGSGPATGSHTGDGGATGGGTGQGASPGTETSSSVGGKAGCPDRNTDRSPDQAAGSTGGDGHDDGSESAGDEHHEHPGHDGHAGRGDGGGDGTGDPQDPEDPEVVGERDLHPSDNDADDPPATCPTCGGPAPGTGPPSGPGPVTRPRDVPLRRLLPNATLYLHMTDQSLHAALAGHAGPGLGVARCEGLGPITVEQVVEFLGHTNVRVLPVTDPTTPQPVDGYEVPAALAEAVHLRNPACISPWGTNRSRHVDLEHIRPYTPLDRGGPPGQTSLDNLGPMSRFPHRVKTHGSWTLKQTGPGTYEWRSPHGYRYRVDNQGTHPLGKQPPETATHPETAGPVLDLDALRGRVIWSNDHAEIYEVDFTLDPSAWKHSA